MKTSTFLRRPEFSRAGRRHRYCGGDLLQGRDQSSDHFDLKKNFYGAAADEDTMAKTARGGERQTEEAGGGPFDR